MGHLRQSILDNEADCKNGIDGQRGRARVINQSMAKLYFRYGTMGSAKTMNLLAVAHSYQIQNKKVLVLKPKLDSRFGADSVRSRSGLEKPADILVEDDTRLDPRSFKNLSCILVDEAQFLKPEFIDHLRAISRDHGIPVICYGLRADFKTELFPGSKRLMELSDSIEEIKNTCHYCNRKSIFNMRLVNGKGVVEGPQILLGAEETYLSVCATCYHERTSKSVGNDKAQRAETRFRELNESF